MRTLSKTSELNDTYFHTYLQLIIFIMLVGVICMTPNLLLIDYRNLFGPLDNQTLVRVILCIRTFGNVCNFFLCMEAILFLYITEKIFKAQPKMDDVGMAECFVFFTVTLSAGLTLLAFSVGPLHHYFLIKYTGLPFDFSQKYLLDSG